ncbi:PAS domain S-box-containing protein/diguanylate cyclase (GGDEF) domain-containing protein [Peptoclostridium litorale DSM 5388]|uniref:Response regulator receiver modulated diguanylate cyclase/phosphodiesterase with PAS/PAC sensor(S) n=1 Tax=Peptoclostridium litorale DSM 5388 TaxID=1121324 RepID=A0A069RCZ2_PEPLI|nr:diguanylate cyclase [Peptoclostridium litorale]KDR94608.1 response regulator receiver modulated diguanylate cyclase/phosphodiesterase with PAS/PAC sensor(S) [Peptoclostridium litorale DSM 5388]SIO32073.1 PAS domain S-box-containing protein/diguanylate cyclase (GGDEF) domain-containing protein [Peptoclostridium litorale DSM 5388]
MDDFEKRHKGAGKVVNVDDEMYKMLFYANPNVMFIVDPNTQTLVEANKAAEDFYGYSRDEIIGKPLDAIDTGDFESVPSKVRFVMEGRQMSNTRHRLCDASTVEVKVLAVPVEIGENIVLNVTVFPQGEYDEEYGEEHPAVRKYFQMALHDELTELPNKRFLKMRIEEEMKRADRENSEFVLIFIDMDNFKRINDDFGHVTGDKLLSMVGKRLKKSVRGNDFAARFGGDEFGIILSGIKDKEAARIIAKRIIRCFENPFSIDGKWIEIKCSMGMSVYPEDGSDFNSLIRAADVEMYSEKKSSGLECITAVSCSAGFYRD